MNGILVVDKPKGVTSHDVVNRVRRMLQVQRVGHAGTLDPLATGVLVLCLGKATRIVRYLESDEKEYLAELRLGVATDTQDAEGRVIETTPYAPPSPVDIDRTLRSLLGVQAQRPPSFSAVKVRGVPSYRLARQGILQELQARQITVHDISLVSYADPLLRFSVRCSKGTYIRTLCSEIGSRLGCGAHLTALARTRAGKFRIEQAWNLEHLERAAAAGAVQQGMISVSDALEGMPRITVTADQARRVLHGQMVSAVADATWQEQGQHARLIGPDGGLLAIAACGGGKPRLEVVFS